VIQFDSSFLIDLLRETTSERLGPAFEFMEGLDDREELAVSIHACCELRVGAELSKRASAHHETLDRFLANFTIVRPDEAFTLLFARLAAASERSGKRVPAMDLLIGTAALIHDAPLVTRHSRDFARIPGLRTLSY
jgi:predicted nucleic acid-binding protein